MHFILGSKPFNGNNCAKRNLFKNPGKIRSFPLLKVIPYGDFECKQLSSFRYLHYCPRWVSRPLYEMPISYWKAFRIGGDKMWLLENSTMQFYQLTHRKDERNGNIWNEKWKKFLIPFMCAGVSEQCEISYF
jgi:hypothetical protein